MKPTLLILAAGMGSRYGGLKQIDGIGPNQEPIIEYSIYDAVKSGFGKIVFVIRREFEEAFRSRFDKFADNIQIDYAYQEVNINVEGIVTVERTKPWGTSHAVLVAKDLINEPFAVINADDYYGAESFKLIAEFLGRGGAWLDTGSIDDFYKTSSFVSALENRQGLKIACLEEIALNYNWIKKKDIKEAVSFYGDCLYSNYLKKLI